MRSSRCKIFALRDSDSVLEWLSHSGKQNAGFEINSSK